MHSKFKPTFLVTSVAIFASACFTPAQAQKVQTPAVQNARFQIQSYPDVSQTLKFHIYLPLRNIAQQDSLIADRSSQSSPQYHQFLTPAQFREQFGNINFKDSVNQPLNDSNSYFKDSVNQPLNDSNS